MVCKEFLPRLQFEFMLTLASRLILTEGFFTVLLGIAVFFFLPNCKRNEKHLNVCNNVDWPGPIVPADAKWLSEKEQSFIQARLPIQSPRDSEKDFDLKQFIRTLKDYKVWLFLSVWSFYTVGTTPSRHNLKFGLTLIFIGTTGLTFYQPTVIANLGYT